MARGGIHGLSGAALWAAEACGVGWGEVGGWAINICSEQNDIFVCLHSLSLSYTHTHAHTHTIKLSDAVHIHALIATHIQTDTAPIITVFHPVEACHVGRHLTAAEHVVADDGELGVWEGDLSDLHPRLLKQVCDAGPLTERLGRQARCMVLL